MTIKKGQPWGAPAPRPADLILADGDAELAELVTRDAGGAFGIRGGDLHRSLGAPSQRDETQLLTVDALRVRVDDREMLAVAHVVARNGWWRGPLLAVLNCAYVGDWNVAPRAHPNDGHFDVVEVSENMSLRQRLQARRRLPRGNHLPHPQIAVRTGESTVWVFDAPDHFSIHI